MYNLHIHTVNSFRGLNGRKDEGTEKDKVDSFNEKGDKETKHTIKRGSMEKGGFSKKK